MYIPAVCFMVIIFWFSSQPAIESSAESSRVVCLILHCLEHIRGIKFSPEEFACWTEWIHTPVRKMAHMAEYAILAWTLLIPLLIQNKEQLYRDSWIAADRVYQRLFIDKKILLKLCLYSLLTVMLYASTDEFHQIFVEGRSGKVTDVLIDTCGAALGIFVFLPLWRIIIGIRGKSRKL